MDKDIINQGFVSVSSNALTEIYYKQEKIESIIVLVDKILTEMLILHADLITFIKINNQLYVIFAKNSGGIENVAMRKIDLQMLKAIVCRIKIMARMSIAERSRPQWGYIDFNVAGVKIKLSARTLIGVGTETVEITKTV